MGSILRRFDVFYDLPDKPEFGARDHICWEINMLNTVEVLARKKITELPVIYHSSSHWEVTFTGTTGEKIHANIYMTDEFYEFGGKSATKSSGTPLPRPKPPTFT